jgi:hypothetical protein
MLMTQCAQSENELEGEEKSMLTSDKSHTITPSFDPEPVEVRFCSSLWLLIKSIVFLLFVHF